MADKREYKIISSETLITPKRGSIFFAIKHPLIEYQTIGWFFGQLEWKEKTLITPFLTDLRLFIENKLAMVKGLKKEEINRTWFELKNRFLDWNIKISLIFKKKKNLFEFFICGQLYVYLIFENKFKPLALGKKEISSFYLDTQKGVGVLIVDQPLPANIILDDLDEFSRLLKARGIGFVIFVPQKSDSHLKIGQWLKKIIVGHYPILLSLFTTLFLLLVIVLISHFHNHSQTKLINPPINQEGVQNNTPNQDVQKMLTETYRLADLDPERARLDLIKVKILAQKEGVTNGRFWQRVFELDKKLNHLAADQKFLLFNNQVFFPRGGVYWHNQLIFYDKNNIVGFIPNNQTKLIYHSVNEILDIQSRQNQLYFLTTKGIFRLQDVNDAVEVATLPVGAAGNQIDVYAGNLYLLSQDGRVYKYPRGAVRFPSQASLYFYSPDLKDSRQMVVDKKFYFLTSSGRFVVYYFGKKQSFAFDKKIEPLRSFYFDDSERLFYFLNSNHWGFFDNVGRVIEIKKISGEYDRVIGYKKQLFLLKDNYFKEIKQ